MTKKYTKYRSLKKWVKVLIKCMILVFFALGSFLIFSSLNLNSPIKEIILSYDIEESADTKVDIKENNYIDIDSIDKNANYISDLVDNIKVNFNYILDATKSGDYKYNYDIKATIYGEYQGSTENENSKLWTKEYVLLDNQEKSVNDTNSVSISEATDIDFPLYNQEVSNFKKDLNVPIVAYMEVVLKVNVLGNVEGNEIKDSKTQKIIIPLNQVAFSIKKEIPNNDHKNITHVEDNRNINMIKFDIGILFIVYSFTMLFLTFNLIFTKQSKTKYEIELDRILKTYGEVIVELLTPINIENKDIVLVKSFNEMLDLEEELRIPINFIQIGKDVGEFSIVNGEICYKFILKDNY